MPLSSNFADDSSTYHNEYISALLTLISMKMKGKSDAELIAFMLTWTITLRSL